MHMLIFVFILSILLLIFANLIYKTKEYENRKMLYTLTHITLTALLAFTPYLFDIQNNPIGFIAYIILMVACFVFASLMNKLCILENTVRLTENQEEMLSLMEKLADSVTKTEKFFDLTTKSLEATQNEIKEIKKQVNHEED